MGACWNREWRGWARRWAGGRAGRRTTLPAWEGHGGGQSFSVNTRLFGLSLWVCAVHSSVSMPEAFQEKE